VKEDFILKKMVLRLKILASAPNSSVDTIEFYANDLLIGEITGSQVKFIWQSMDEGQYGIKAIAYFSRQSKSRIKFCKYYSAISEQDTSNFFTTKAGIQYRHTWNQKFRMLLYY
jgi:hypothetical protein